MFGRLNGDVAAAPFDLDELRITGPAVTMLDNVFIKSGGASEFGVARDGTLYFVPGTAYGEVLLMDKSGTTRVVLSELRAYSRPRMSPRGNRFVFEMTDRASFSQRDVWVFNDLTRTLSRLTNDGNSISPAWMPDGERIVWLHNDTTGTIVKRQRWDGSGRPEVLFAGEPNITEVVPAPDGERFAVVKQGQFSDLYMAEGDSAATLRPLVVTRQGEGGPRFSPDGKWLAYYGDESGQREVYVIASTGDDGRRQVSIEGGSEPVWSPDGKTLYYRAGGSMIAAQISTSPDFSVTSCDVVFNDRYRRLGFGANYDVSRDGNSFLLLGIGTGNQGTQQIAVVTGWQHELVARMAQATSK